MFTKSKFKRDLHALTTDEDLMPPASAFLKIAEASFDARKCEVILKHLFKKLQEPPAKYRKINKALVLAEALLEAGSKKVVFELKNKAFLITNLIEFTYISKKQNLGLPSEIISSGEGSSSCPALGGR